MDTDVAPAKSHSDASATASAAGAAAPGGSSTDAGRNSLMVPDRASLQNGTYPRPQLMRPHWVDLCGHWGLRFDDDERGLAERWFDEQQFEQQITVPFPPESPASGIGDSLFHPTVWYQLTIAEAQREAAGPGERLLLHFGAVDYRASVWLNGMLLGHHEGGHTPFSFDITDALLPGAQSLVVRANDDPLDVAQPRGKQDWMSEPHSIWYHRTTGIWQPVWLEAVPALSVQRLAFEADVARAEVAVSVELSRRPDPGTLVEARLYFDDELVGSSRSVAEGDRVELTVHLSRQLNGQNYEHLLWSHEHPRLIDAVVTVSSAEGAVAGPGAGDAAVVDTVSSYLGLRSVAVDRGQFLLNDRPVYLRSVLSQGYWPGTHLAPPSADALRAEVQLIKDLGFNAARVHQKIEDPRFLFWADRLGLLLWEEMPSAYEFSPTAVRRVMAEWAEIITRDRSHPSIVTWVPLNESWGVQHVAHSETVQNYVRALLHLTKALDGTRPVVSNDGWEHLDSDIWSIHDYEASGDVVAARYADRDAVDLLFDGLGPAGRRLRLSDEPDRGQPVMLTEFGGVKFGERREADDASWGYSEAHSADDFAARLTSLLGGVGQSTVLSGFCYTQLTDTGQETNGLTYDDRAPKLPLDVMRRIFGADGGRPGGVSGAA